MEVSSEQMQEKEEINNIVKYGTTKVGIWTMYLLTSISRTVNRYVEVKHQQTAAGISSKVAIGTTCSHLLIGI